MGSTIITLGTNPEPKGIIQQTFEEVFGEFSELRGRGRNRRTTRKVGKKQTKQNKRMTRIGYRGERKQAKQGIRLNQQGGRILKKDTRKIGRLNRRALGDPEQEMDNQTAMETGNGVQQQYEQPQYEQPTDEQPTEQPMEEQPMEQPMEEQPQDQPQEVDFGSEESESEDDVMSEDESSFSAEVASGKAQINPKVQDCANRVEWNKELVARLNKRKHDLGLLLENEQEPANILQINQQIANIDSEISSTQERISNLDGMLSDYCNFSDAKGGKKVHPKKNAEVKMAKNIARVERAKISIAKPKSAAAQAKSIGGKMKSAVKSNSGVIKIRPIFKSKPKPTMAPKSPIKSKYAQAPRPRPIPADYGGSEIPVDSELNPEFEDQRITIEAENSNNYENQGNYENRGNNDFDENSDFSGNAAGKGIGLIALDENNDYDAPEDRVFDVKSSFSGNATSLAPNTQKVLTILAVGALVIWGLKAMEKKHILNI